MEQFLATCNEMSASMLQMAKKVDLTLASAEINALGVPGARKTGRWPGKEQASYKELVLTDLNEESTFKAVSKRMDELANQSTRWAGYYYTVLQGPWKGGRVVWARNNQQPKCIQRFVPYDGVILNERMLCELNEEITEGFGWNTRLQKGSIIALNSKGMEYIKSREDRIAGLRTDTVSSHNFFTMGGSKKRSLLPYGFTPFKGRCGRVGPVGPVGGAVGGRPLRPYKRARLTLGPLGVVTSSAST
jgi:hypothetical protein